MGNYSLVKILGTFKACHLCSRFALQAQVFSCESTQMSLKRALLCRLCNIEQKVLDNRVPVELYDSESAEPCMHLHFQHKKLLCPMLTRSNHPAARTCATHYSQGQQKRFVYLQGLIK